MCPYRYIMLHCLFNRLPHNGRIARMKTTCNVYRGNERKNFIIIPHSISAKTFSKSQFKSIVVMIFPSCTQLRKAMNFLIDSYLLLFYVQLFRFFKRNILKRYIVPGFNWARRGKSTEMIFPILG